MENAFFIISKLITPALKLETWLLILAGITFWANRRHWSKLVDFGAATMFLTFLGIGAFPIGDILMRPLETEFPVQMELQEVDGIIVLGGGEDVPASLHSGQPQIGEGGDRYLAAFALARKFPDAQLLFSGGSGRLRDLSRSEVTEAAIAEQIFQSQGIASHRTLFESRSRNTTENARLSYAQAKPEEGEQWVLVTSAFHMPRAMMSFKAAGWQEIIPFPVDFQTRSWSSGLGWNFQRNLRLTNMAIREWIGRLVLKLSDSHN
ncbi:YdcF family protein [uncultured Marivita sp.]|uniref:YdcF family protein n=1 Tax=uncultured Marivita sp. TaxID=888080 RepID=UPI00262F42D5|nr:YdcF family protein [uncultured Marivita sp.]